MAPRSEVAPTDPVGGDRVVDPGSGLVEQNGRWSGLAETDAQLGLLATQRRGPDPADPLAEAADQVEHLTAERHVAPDQVPDRGELHRETGPAATDHPLELGGEPRWM